MPNHAPLPRASRRTLEIGGRRVHYPSLAAAIASRGTDVSRLPFSVRVLAENVARHAPRLGREATAALDALARWPNPEGAALPLTVPRVILPDSSGLPVLLDLAAMREAFARAGAPP